MNDHIYTYSFINNFNPDLGSDFEIKGVKIFFVCTFPYNC